MMHLLRALLLVSTSALFATTAMAHISVYGVWVNGVYQGDGKDVYVRAGASPYHNPIRNVAWSYIACNTRNKVRPRYIDVKPGDKLAFEWYWQERNDFYLGNHIGPVLAYIAPSSVDVHAPQAWTKVFQEGFRNGSWATRKFAVNGTGGHHDITIPDIAAGDYLVRAEVITLQDAAHGYAQLYPICSQIRITNSTGKAKLPGGSTFPGSYTQFGPGLKWDLNKDDPTKYVFPGEPVWEGSAGGEVFERGGTAG